MNRSLYLFIIGYTETDQEAPKKKKKNTPWYYQHIKLSSTTFELILLF